MALVDSSGAIPCEGITLFLGILILFALGYLGVNAAAFMFSLPRIDYDDNCLGVVTDVAVADKAALLFRVKTLECFTGF